MSESEQIREMIRMREKALHDEASALANAENKGIAKGRAEGREEGISIGEAKAKKALIEKMRKRGMSEDEINEFFSDN